MNPNLSCPVCAGTCSLFDVVDFNKSCEEANGKFLPQAGIPIYYARCGKCGFCFAPEIAAWSPDEFEKKIYNDEYAIVDPDYVELRPRTNATNLIAMFGDQTHSIKHLDYGGGAGLLARLLKESNWQSSSYDPFVDRNTHIGQLGKFDLITAFEVFEHVPNVLELMSNLRSLLAPNGLVLFSTLLSDGQINPGQRIDWWYASPRNGHISLFSRKSLTILAQKYGFNFVSFDVGMHAFFTKIPHWAVHLEKLITVNTLSQQPDSQSITQPLQQAVTLHRSGLLQEAGERYQAILQTQPNHPEANYNLGMIAVQTNQPAAGLPYFMAALDADPARGQYWLSYIDALFQAGQLEDARQILALARQQGLEGNDVEVLAQRLEAGPRAAERPGTQAEKKPDPQEINTLLTLFSKGSLSEATSLAQSMTERFPLHEFGWKVLGALLKQMGRNADALAPMQKAVELSPGDVEAHHILGVTLYNLGRLGEAEASYRRALQINPAYADAHSNLGVTLHQSGRLDEAEVSLRRALEIQPDNAETYSNLGVTLQALDRLDEAETCYRRALQIKPDNVEAHNNLGTTLQKLGRMDESEASLRRALELKPDYAQAHCNLAVTLHDMGRLEDASVCYRRAIEIKPDLAEAHNNLGNTFLDLGRLAEAETCCRRALEIKPDYPKAHHSLSLILLTMGRLSEGWPEYEYRWETFSPKLLLRPNTDLSQWKGQIPLPGDRLLVFREQGLGDQIQFSRYLPLAANRFANCVSIVVAPPLLTLFRRSFPNVEILETAPADQSPWQWQCSLLSLPLAFDTTLDTIPNHVPYLTPDPARVSYWKSRITALTLPTSAHKIGIVWKPGSGMKNAQFRALSLQQLGPLLELPGHTWFSLQKEPDPDKEPFVISGKLVDWTDEFSDFDDTAALVVNLDLVISVDTSVVHLAGGLGRPVWLFNSHASEWRWMRDREDCSWYPTMRIFTQKTAGDWGEVVSRMAATLQQTNQSEEARQTLTAERHNTQAEKSPNPQEINTLLTLFSEGRFIEAASLAKGMTERFPLHEFGWKALGAVFKQMGRDVEALAPMQRAAALAPGDVEAHYNLGVTLHQLGRQNEAEASYRRALQIDPAYADAYSNLGVTLQDLGRLDEAEACYRSVLKIKPDSAEAYSNLGVTLQALGRLGEAETCYRRALQITPDKAEALSNLGITLHELGRMDEAEGSLRRALEINPHYADAYFNLGITLQQMGRLDEAEACYWQALQDKPDYAEAHYNLGNTLKDLNRLGEAAVCYRRALKIKPDYADTHYNLGNTLKDLNRLDEAAVCYRQALQIKPDYADAHFNLGDTLQDLERPDEAEACYRQALQIKPDYAEAHNNLGIILKDLGRVDEAEACFRRALEIKPDYARAHTNLGNCKLDLGQLDEAEVHYRKALEIEPNYFLAHSNLLFSLNYASSESPADCFSEAVRYGHNIKNQVTSQFTEWTCAKHPERLRVGFVSGDFSNHPVGYFMESLLNQIDTKNIELIAYPTSPKTDELTARIKPFFSAWKTLFGLNDEVAAHLIHSDSVHILIDLSGHSSHNRLPVFAWKPAPVQVSWLGYFATTGVTEIDYLIADPWTLPETEEAYFTEKIWRLPETRLCFTPPDIDLAVSSLPALRNGYVTFSCFNNLTKMNEEVVALWSRVLSSVPTSRLFLKAKQLNEAAARQHTIERFAAYDIEANRLILEGFENREKYLAVYQRVDIALDPFPFPGGTTSVEGLWMGVPVLTLAGERFLSRQGVGILMNAGLPDWVARNEDDYIARATSHAADLLGLSKLRNGLRQQVMASPLMDAKRFANNFEAALYDIFQA